MPSVTDTIVPTLRASVTALKFSIRCLIRSLISVALIAMCFGSSKLLSVCLDCQLVRDPVEPGAQRAVDDEVAGAQHGSADELRVRLAVQAHRPFQLALERGRERLLLSLVQRRGGGDCNIDDTFRLVFQL